LLCEGKEASHATAPAARIARVGHRLVLGYILGIAPFFALPAALIGWVILLAGLAFAVWVMMTRVNENRMASYAVVALVWTVIGVV
jgi:uncharacterized membrane protein YccC